MYVFGLCPEFSASCIDGSDCLVVCRGGGAPGLISDVRRESEGDMRLAIECGPAVQLCEYGGGGPFE